MRGADRGAEEPMGDGVDRAREIGVQMRDFTGRAWLFAEIELWCADPTAPNVLLLTGEPGIGKTAIAARLTQIRPVDAVHFCIARQAETIEPLRFTRGLAEQLARIDGFAQELLGEHGMKLTIRQEVGVNQGQVIGAQIGALVLEARSATVAFARTVLTPLKRLYEEGYEQPLLVVIDGLDEAAMLTGRETIVRLLAESGELPRPVRLLLTTRPEPTVLRYFEGTPHRLLDASSGENQADVRQYIGARLAASAALGVQVAAAGLDGPTFIERVADVSRGNFLYLVWLLPAIERGEQMLANRAALPAGLDGIYRAFLRSRTVGEDERHWRSAYRPLLGLLAAAQEPLIRDLLADLSGMGAQALDDSLRDLQQFFDPVLAAAGQYRLYHASLTDFLGERERAAEFWIDLAAVHRRIGDFYWERYASDWAACDRSGLISLATHLYQGGDYKRLHALFADDLWLQARVARDGYNYDGYLADLSQAWQLAQRAMQQATDAATGGIYLAACIHYALIRTSINALAGNYHPALVVRAVKTGIWSVERGLSVANRVVDPEKRVAMIAALLATGHGSEEQCLNATAQALEIALALPNESNRAKALVALAPQLNSNLLARGLDAVMKFEDSWHQVQMLTALAPQLNNQQHELVIEVGLAVFAIQDEWNRTRILTALAPLLPEDLLKKYLPDALAFQSESNRAEALTVFAGYLSEDLLIECFAAALSMTDCWNQARVLAALAPKLTGDLLTQGLDAASAMKDRASQVRVLAALAPQLTEQQRIGTLAHAFDLICEITDKWGQVEALSLLIPHLLVAQREEAITRALDIVSEITDDESRSGALTALAPHLSGNLLKRGLTIALGIEDEESRIDVLAALAPQLSGDLLKRCLALALKIEDEWYRMEALAALAPQLDHNLLEHGFATLLATEDIVVRAEVLKEFAPYLSDELLIRGFDAALAINNEIVFADALKAIIPHLPADLLQRCHKAALKIENITSRTKVLAALAAQLSSQQREQVLGDGLDAILAVEDEENRSWALREIASHLTNNLLERGVAAALEIKVEYYRVLALEALGPWLSSELLTRGLTAVDTIANKEYQARLLAALTSQFSGQHDAQALYDHLDAALAVEDTRRRAEALARLAPHLTGDLLERSLAAALSFENEMWRAKVLADLVPYLTDTLLAQVQKAVLAFENDAYRAKVLVQLLKHIPDYSMILQVMQQVIADHLWRKLQARDRGDVLGFVGDKALFTSPVIDVAASRAIAHSILDICWKWRWM